ncbi:DUF5714 domain-containing protein [Ruminococcaceae bacterium OttesenSCG-928-A16]|nr:DUF5714 domain-containing protein [Ruminococcaceae bacterium OttesenSCG-928-A16]
MPIKLEPKCPVCGQNKFYFEEDVELTKPCDICGVAFEADASCENGHHVCHTCRQKSARQAMIAHCLKSSCQQPYPLVLELMKLPEVAMHGPEHHLLLTAALLTSYCNEKGRQPDLPAFLAEADERSMEVPGGACGFWGICGAAIGSGIYISIVTGANPYAGAEWKASGQLTAQCGSAVACQGGPRCCKRDTFLSLKEAAPYSNTLLDTHFIVPEDYTCEFYPSNEDCKRLDCPFFPVKKEKA